MKKLLTVVLSCLLFIAGCDKHQPAEQLVIFHAGSLSVPFAEIAEKFEEQNPGIKVVRESAGSRACARKVTELKKRCDVLASADYKVVSNLVMPEYAKFNVRFALNEMVIGYTEKSRHGENINAENWQEILLNKDVNVGRSDPDSDPCGYRTLMTMQLAEKYYKKEGFYNNLKAKDKFIRPKETDLLGLLDVGEIDYIFIYRSVATQHGLEILLLPDEINLKSSELSNIYNTAVVKITGKSPGEYIERIGEPMVYSVTIPTTAANRTAAEKFIKLVLSEDGRAIMEKNGQPTVSPAIAGGYEYLPESLKSLCKPALENE